MTFLPIIDRELRVAARRRGTYRVRLAVALIAVLAGTLIFLANLGSSPNRVGQNIFLGLAGVCAGYCVLSGRISTADCLSEEKREGTLGLLFLTDLKGYDIVLGKLVSTSMGALYGLLAVMPVLAVPLLLGGVTSGEFWRMVLVLVNTFLFSLAIGMFSSAVCRDAHRAAAANFALSVFLLAALPLVLFGIPYLSYQSYKLTTPPLFALSSSPFYSFYLCPATRYATNPVEFWLSSALVALQSFFLIAAACRIVPRTWQDKTTPAPRRARRNSWSDYWRVLNYGEQSKLAPFRKQLLDRNAFYWLASRARLKPLHVWVFLGLAALWWIFNWWNASGLRLEETAPLAFSLAAILNCTFKAWIALEAGRQLAEDQKAGAFELLLATPLTFRDILHGQYLALRRQFLKPLLVTVAVEIILTPLVLQHLSDWGFQFHLWLAGIVMLVADVVTLPVVSMRMALTEKNPNRAVLATVSRVLILPWIIFSVGGGLYALWNELFSPYIFGFRHAEPAFYLALWFWCGIVVDAFFGVRAWRQLTTRFRELATHRFAPAPARAAHKIRSLLRLSHRKKLALAGAGMALAAVCAYCAWQKSKPAYPPPLEVSITQSNAPLRVFPGPNTYFILPDSSLWRWGNTGFSGGIGTPALTPQRVETNADWVQASSMAEYGAGLRKDGTLWTWSANQTPTGQMDSAHDWAKVSTGNRYFVAIKKDGTLWGWGDNYPNWMTAPPATTRSTNLAQIGSEAGWADVLCHFGYALALRTNGTLWVWGQPWSQQTGRVNYSAPTLVCNATNWTGLSRGFGSPPWAWNASGEVWQLTPALADATASPAAIGELLSSDAVPGRLAAGFLGEPDLFEVRQDGTLWEKAYSIPSNFIVPPGQPWRQMGSRSDWQKVWCSGGTVFGLTADGTLWLWGLDPTRRVSWTVSMRIQLVEEWFKERAGAGTGPIVTRSSQPWLIQETPRPLLHLNYSR